MIAVRQETCSPAFIFASLLAAYPGDRFRDDLGQLVGSGDLLTEESGPLRESFNRVRARLADILDNQQALDDLRSEYINLFDRGRQTNSLYETEYGRERAMVKGNQLVDIAGFYKAFGLETGGDGVQAEMIDHVAVQLEFYALLAMKSEVLSENGDALGVEIVLDGQKKFLTSHLGRFIGAICERPGVASSPFYLAIFEYCRDLVSYECERLGVEAEPENWISGQSDLGEVSCGGSVGCTK